MFLICRTEALLEYHHDDDRHHLDSFHLLGCCSSHGMGRLWLWAYEDLLHTGLHQRGQVDLHRCRNDAKTGMLTGPISFRFSAYKNFNKYKKNRQMQRSIAAWQIFPIFHIIFLFISFQQGLCDLHANSGAALPDVPSHHHVVMLWFHLQTLQEGPSPQGKYTAVNWRLLVIKNK